MRIVGAGLYVKYLGDVTHGQALSRVHAESRIQILDLEDVLGQLYLFLTGIAVSSIVFVTEVLFTGLSESLQRRSNCPLPSKEEQEDIVAKQNPEGNVGIEQPALLPKPLRALEG